jgi:multidrug resistance efflux pump
MRIAVFLALLVLPASIVLADDPEMARVERGDLQCEIAANGSFQADPVGVVIPSPRAWRGRYVVAWAIEPGAPVQAGDVVMRFFDLGLEDEVANARFDLETAVAELDIRIERMRLSEKAHESEVVRHVKELAAAERALEGFLTHEKPTAAEQRALNDESSVHSVENSKEELDQLLKMYEEDELVDDTERIVLRRARWNLRFREVSAKLSKKRRVYSETYEEAAREKRLLREVERRRVALEQARGNAELSAESAAIELQRAQRGVDRKRRHLERLETDLAGLVTRAPASGILLHGAVEGGFGRRYSPGTQLNAQQAAVTVVDPDASVAVLNVPAKEVLRVSPGLDATIEPGGNLRVRCRISGSTPRGLLGHACEGRIVSEKLSDVLTVPLAAVREEDGGTWCLRYRELGDPDRVPVVTGLDDGERVVIRKGLVEGDTVILPKAVK